MNSVRLLVWSLRLPLSLGALLLLGLLFLVVSHYQAKRPRPEPVVTVAMTPPPVAIVEPAPAPPPLPSPTPPPPSPATSLWEVEDTGHLLSWFVLVSILWTAFWLFLYLLPAVIACLRHHHNAGAIAALNFLFGWTVLGWFGALIWALTNPAPTAAPATTVVVVRGEPHLSLPEEVRHALCQENLGPPPGRSGGFSQRSL